MPASQLYFLANKNAELTGGSQLTALTYTNLEPMQNMTYRGLLTSYTVSGSFC